jgi:hypothetical protein
LVCVASVSQLVKTDDKVVIQLRRQPMTDAAPAAVSKPAVPCLHCLCCTVPNSLPQWQRCHRISKVLRCSVCLWEWVLLLQRRNNHLSDCPIDWVMDHSVMYCKKLLTTICSTRSEIATFPSAPAPATTWLHRATHRRCKLI